MKFYARLMTLSMALLHCAPAARRWTAGRAGLRRSSRQRARGSCSSRRSPRPAARRPRVGTVPGGLLACPIDGGRCELEGGRDSGSHIFIPKLVLFTRILVKTRWCERYFLDQKQRLRHCSPRLPWNNGYGTRRRRRLRRPARRTTKARPRASAPRTPGRVRVVCRWKSEHSSCSVTL